MERREERMRKKRFGIERVDARCTANWNRNREIEETTHRDVLVLELVGDGLVRRRASEAGEGDEDESEEGELHSEFFLEARKEERRESESEKREGSFFFEGKRKTTKKKSCDDFFFLSRSPFKHFFLHSLKLLLFRETTQKKKELET